MASSDEFFCFKHLDMVYYCYLYRLFQVNVKKIAIIKNSHGKNETITLSEDKAEERVLDNYEIKRLAQYAKQLEEHYKKPQDIEFAVDSSGIYIVQSRPVTTFFKESKDSTVKGELLFSGYGASPGVASGTVKVVYNLEDLEKVKSGDVLVTEMTNPDMVVSMERAAAIVTDEGGITSHAAIVSREMGIPCVVGTGGATKKLKDGDAITVDGNVGKVYAGRGETKLIVIEPIVSTKTEIKVIVDIPNFAERAAKSGARAVGLLRLEGIIAEGGKHPLKFVKDKRMKDYIELIRKGVKHIAEHFEELWVRTSDIRSDEYKNLEGAPQHVEGNPMLGDHGVRFSLKHPDIMKAELIGLKEVADDFPDKIFGIMVPQVISVEEVKETKKIAKEVGIPSNIKIGIMVETPAAVQIINELCEEGLDFISFGTNDLTQFTLAIDRNNEEVQHLFDEMHPAVLNSLSYVIRKCKKYGVKTSICGQAGSREEMAAFLVREGIGSISVNADAARKVSLIVAEVEKKQGIHQDHNKPFNEKNDYHPGESSKKHKDTPVLNDSISLSSEMF
ncbi:MAG: putative PEP-binding protein [Nanoarchaeota archaeon]